MSRTGKKPIALPKGVEVKASGLTVTVKGPKGTLEKTFTPGVAIAVENGHVAVTRLSETPLARSLHGMTRSIINGMIEGVTKGFEKSLEVKGTGYKIKLAGRKLTLNVGYSHPVDIEAPQGIDLAVDEKAMTIKVSGIDKALVGQVAADIRDVKRADPYKLKGVKYTDERIIQKVGKRAK